MIKYQHPNYHSHHRLPPSPKIAQFLPHSPLSFPLLAFPKALPLQHVALLYFIGVTYFWEYWALQKNLFWTIFLGLRVESSISWIFSCFSMVPFPFTPLSAFSFVLFYLFCSYPYLFPQGSYRRNGQAPVRIATFTFLPCPKITSFLTQSWYPIFLLLSLSLLQDLLLDSFFSFLPGSTWRHFVFSWVCALLEPFLASAFMLFMTSSQAHVLWT